MTDQIDLAAGHVLQSLLKGDDKAALTKAGIAGADARDVDTPYSVFTELRRFPSALYGVIEAWSGTR